MSGKLHIVSWSLWFANLELEQFLVKKASPYFAFVLFVEGSGCVRACSGETRHLATVSFNLYTNQQFDESRHALIRLDTVK